MSSAHNSKILTQIMKIETFTYIVKHCTEIRNKKDCKDFKTVFLITMLKHLSENMNKKKHK